MSANRATEPGWVLASMHDQSGRRGIWWRHTPDALEVCAGREGDDYYVRLEAYAIITPDVIRLLAEALSIGSWMLSERDDDQAHGWPIYRNANEEETSD